MHLSLKRIPSTSKLFIYTRQTTASSRQTCICKNWCIVISPRNQKHKRPSNFQSTNTHLPEFHHLNSSCHHIHNLTQIMLHFLAIVNKIFVYNGVNLLPDFVASKVPKSLDTKRIDNVSDF